MGKIKLKRALELDVIDFAENTSAHGIPRAYVSNGCRRVLWLSFFFICLFAFSYQAFLIIQRFNRNDIMVGVEIKFEEIRFPAVTICNMNPYKNSAAREIPEIKIALEHFEEQVRKADLMHSPPSRKKRSHNPKIIAVETNCQYENDGYLPDRYGADQCICASFDEEEEEDGYLWNCHLSSTWSHRICEWKNDEKNEFMTCNCHQDFCLKDGFKSHIAWPLKIQKSAKNSSKICISLEEESSNSPEYCGNVDHFHVATCHKCDWLGRCEEMDSLSENHHKCICHHNTCFQIKKIKSSRGKRDIVAKRKVQENFWAKYERLLAIKTACNCTKPTQCEWSRKSKVTEENKCLCFYHTTNDVGWPCYKEEIFEETRCNGCMTLGNCNSKNETHGKYACLCAPDINMCVRIDSKKKNNGTLEQRLVNYGDIAPSTTISPIQKKKEDREKAYGYAGVTDLIALRAKAMENIIFAVDALTTEQKLKIVHNKTDFIKKCSFNGKECHVNKDFIPSLDPTYGACFTYQVPSVNGSNERPGPAYGLRLELFVNVTEYLPYTESAGVRLTVHSREEHPFPDTAGFSAPVGFVSSFGIKLKTMARLALPYGKCLDVNATDAWRKTYIYKNKTYSTEGCQRSLMQKFLTDKCGCGDPRSPVYPGTLNCLVDNSESRECIKKHLMDAIKTPGSLGTPCEQPCMQYVYSVSYSASRWPAVPSDNSGCPQGYTSHNCLKYKREQGAMIEVYFEQLNYEYLKESAAYGWSNLLSDFGGQLGLWMGVSVITIMEVSIFICDVITSIIGLRPEKRRPARKSFSSSLRCSHDYNINKDGIIN